MTLPKHDSYRIERISWHRRLRITHDKRAVNKTAISKNSILNYNVDIK